MSNTTITGYAAKAKGEDLQQWSYQQKFFRDSDVEIAIECCGVCGSDIHTIDSGWGATNYPVIPGHEIVGKVISKGKGVKGLSVGDRVGVGPFCQSCKTCEYCTTENSQLCEKLVITYNDNYVDENGTKIMATQGGYADRIVVDEYYAIKIPKEMSSAEAAPLLCAGITTYAPLRKFGVKKGDKVGVISIGGLGHLAVQWASKLGGDVYTYSHSPNKKQEAIMLGSKEFVLLDDVKERSNYLDLVLCTSFSKQVDFNTLLTLVKPKGTFVVLGLPEFYPEINLGYIIKKEICFCGSIVGSPELTEEMLQKAVELDVRPLIQVMGMENCNEAIRKVRQNKAKYRMVLRNNNYMH